MGKLSALFARLTASVSVLVVGSSDIAVSQSSAFSSKQEAQEYLSRTPNGPLAEEAFRFLIFGGIQEQDPEFSTDNVVTGTIESPAKTRSVNEADDDDPVRDTRAAANPDSVY